jgi:transcriptional regulator with XRE-family HTH domain
MRLESHLNGAKTGAMAEEVKPEWAATGKRLRQIELAEAKNGAQIADDLGITAQTWSKYKKGKRELPVWLAAELRKRYGVSLEWLFLGEWHLNNDSFKRRLEAVERGSGANRPARSGEQPRRRAGSGGP